MSGFWERVANAVLIAVVTGMLLATLGAVPTLVIYVTVLLVLVVRHRRYLTILDRWLRTDGSVLPNASGKWADVFARLMRLVREQSRTYQHISSFSMRWTISNGATPWRKNTWA